MNRIHFENGESNESNPLITQISNPTNLIQFFSSKNKMFSIYMGVIIIYNPVCPNQIVIKNGQSPSKSIKINQNLLIYVKCEEKNRKNAFLF